MMYNFSAPSSDHLQERKQKSTQVKEKTDTQPRTSIPDRGRPPAPLSPPPSGRPRCSPPSSRRAPSRPSARAARRSQPPSRRSPSHPSARAARRRRRPAARLPVLPPVALLAAVPFADLHPPLAAPLDAVLPLIAVLPLPCSWPPPLSLRSGRAASTDTFVTVVLRSPCARLGILHNISIPHASVSIQNSYFVVFLLPPVS